MGEERANREKFFLIVPAILEKQMKYMQFREIDVLLLPTITEAIPTIEEARERGAQAVSPDHTFFCNYYGLPAIGVPCGFDANGLPSALQIVGPRWSESAVLAIAHAFQQATPWHEKHPVLA